MCFIRKLKLLVLDDDPGMRKVIGCYFRRRRIEAIVADSIESAKAITDSEVINVAIVDVLLGKGENGKDFCRYLRKNYPEIKIILLSGFPGLFNREELKLCDTHPLQKPIRMRKLYSLVKSLFTEDQEMESIKKNFSSSLSCTYVQKDSRSVEGIIAIPERETKKPLEKRGSIKFVIYKLKEDGPITIGLASSLGCVGRCVFCGSSQRGMVYNLTTAEIIDQIILGATNPFVRTLQGNNYVGNLKNNDYKLKKRLPVKVNVNFTCEGDLVVQNSSRIKEIVSEINNLDFVERITITTMGSEFGFKNLLNIIKEDSNIFRKVRIFWSLNSLKPTVRAGIMKSTIHDDMNKQKILLWEIQKYLKYKITISWIVIKGVNNTMGDAFSLAMFIMGKERSFEVKIQGLRFDTSLVEDTELELIKKVPNNEEVKSFGDKLKRYKIPYRVAEIKDHDKGHGCGSTRAERFSYHTLQDIVGQNTGGITRKVVSCKNLLPLKELMCREAYF